MWAHLCRAGWALLLVNCTKGLENSHLDNDDTFIETHGDLVGIFAQRNTPSALQGIVERIFDSVGSAVPDLDRSILASTDDDREVGVEDGERNVVRMTLHRLHTALAEVVPHFDGLVIAGGDEVGLVGAGIEIDIVDTIGVRIPSPTPKDLGKLWHEKLDERGDDPGDV